MTRVLDKIATALVWLETDGFGLFALVVGLAGMAAMLLAYEARTGGML